LEYLPFFASLNLDGSLSTSLTFSGSLSTPLSFSGSLSTPLSFSGSLSTSLSFLETYFYSRVFALGALQSGLYSERRYINLEIRYDIAY